MIGTALDGDEARDHLDHGEKFVLEMNEKRARHRLRNDPLSPVDHVFVLIF